MSHRSRIIAITACLACWSRAAEPEDWRLQVLAEEGVTIDGKDISELGLPTAPSEKRFQELLPLLAAEDFATRERSQQEILRMGNGVRPWLDAFQPGEEPEINMRIARIREELSSNGRWSNGELLRYAVEGLLLERDGGKSGPARPRVLAELFRDNAPDLGKTYRHFTFMAEPGLSGKVAGGTLRLHGNGRIDGDQRLILDTSRVTGSKVPPEKIRVDVALRGTPGGEGAYHIGISIGRIRALLHPGYPGGAFRFEKIDDNSPLSENRDMGFTPSTDESADMSLEAKRLPGGDTELLATISPRKGIPPFQARIKVPAATIGAPSTISLDRSGREGGDAIFDNLVVETPAP